MAYRILPLFAFAILGILGEDFTNIQINSSSGLYYEGIGEAYLSNNYWEFVTYINYGDYLNLYQYIHEETEKIKEFCNIFNKMVNSSECNSKYKDRKSLLDDIDKNDENMAHYLGVPQTRRVKRFWSEVGQFLSKLGRGLFNILLSGTNNPDLSAYENAIKSLENNQRTMANSMTMFIADAEKKSLQIDWLNQTQMEIQNKLSALENDSERKEQEIQDLQKLLEEIKNKQQEQIKVQNKLVNEVDGIQERILRINKTLTMFNQMIDENTERMNQGDLKIQLLSLLDDLDFIIDCFRVKQQSLFNAIIKAKSTKKGALDPSILSPTSLIKMLQDVVPKLKNEMFPFHPNIENAYRLYNLIEPNVYVTNNKLLFIFKVPLVKNKAFYIHKINSLPVPIAQKTFAFILPKESFLLIDHHETEYMLLPQSDFESCDRFDSTTYVCIQKRYTRFVHTSNECEVQLYTSPHILPNSCDKRIMVVQEPVFIQLFKKNSWIYVAPSFHTRLMIRCYFDRLPVFIEGSGIISFRNICSILYNNEELKPIAEYTRPVVGNFSPEVNLANYIDTSIIQNLENDFSKYEMRLSPFDWKKLEEMSVSLNKLPNYNINLFYLLLVPVVLLLIVTIYFHYKMKMDYKKYKTYISAGVNRLSTIGRFHRDDQLNTGVKLNNKNENICRISLQENPDTEYMTVRFKVRKEEPYLVPKEFSNENDSSENIGAIKSVYNNMLKPIQDNTTKIKRKAPVPTPKIRKELSEMIYSNQEFIENAIMNRKLEHKQDIVNHEPDNIYDNVDNEQHHANKDNSDSTAIYDNVYLSYLDQLRKQKPRVLNEQIEHLRLIKPKQ